jgi:predicted metal-dependent HD superfamily phosphohydrolase
MGGTYTRLDVRLLHKYILLGHSLGVHHMHSTQTQASFVRFNSLRKNLGSRVREETVRALYSRIVGAYGENGRYYHTLAHIDHCLETFDTVRSQCTYPHEVEFAIWFHDVHYDMHHGVDNETLSAISASRACAQLHLSQSQEDLIIGNILATDHLRNTRRALSLDNELMADIDLYPLSLSHDRCVQDRMNIRREYAHVEGRSFAGASLTFFTELISRGYIFQSRHFKQWETNAYENIEYIKHSASSIITARP